METLPQNKIELNNSNCSKCNLCKTRSEVINGYGDIHAKILFVTDMVGGYEEATKKPLQGTNGKIFDRLLINAGISRSDVFITSAIRCKGSSKKQKEINKSIDACKEYLEKEINEIKPNIIVPLGSNALKAILENKTLNITDTRGIVHYSNKYNCKVIPIFHPNYLFMNPHHESVTLIDLLRIKRESKSKLPLVPPKRNHKVITTLKDFNTFLGIYKQATRLAVDIEATGLNWLKDKVIGISFSKASGEGYYIPFTTGSGRFNILTRQLELFWGDNHQVILDGVRELLEGSAEKILHNGSYDIKMLRHALSITVNNFRWDTMLMDHLLYENAKGLHGLENCALRFTDFGSYKQDVINWFKSWKIPKKKRDFSLLPPELLYGYGAEDADVTFTLFDLFLPRLKDHNLLRLFTQVILPTQEVLIETELTGVPIDKEYLTNLEKKYQNRIIELEQEIFKLVGTFKVNSNKELPDMLYNKLKLSPSRRTPSGAWSTDKESLEELKDKHPVVKFIQEYKLTDKILGTFITGILNKLDDRGVLHTNYLLHGTNTGRSSSRNPNLQNIPAGINDIQNAFIAGIDRVFIASDFSQAEFRVWAEFSQDPQMIADCNRGKDFDIHKEVASRSFGIPVSDIGDKDPKRKLAKAVLFGGMYGQSAKSCGEFIGVPVELAYKVQDYIKHRYRVGFAWFKRQHQVAQFKGEVKTLFGRIRHLQPLLESFNEEIRAKALRQAVNSPVQGSVGDLNNIATLRINRRFKKENIDGYLALAIHDSLIFNVKASQQDLASKIIKEEMERPVEGLNVPMYVDVSVGFRWGEVRKIEEEEHKVINEDDIVEEEEIEEEVNLIQQ